MKKINVVLVVLGTLISASVFAKTKTVLTCTNGEEVRVKIVEVTANSYRADVTVQSTGDSYPTYHFKNVEMLPVSARPGAPTVYRGTGFELEIQYQREVSGRLTVPSVGIRNEQLSCSK